jgi:glycosyltransferase involved in cell wall biosynthesis
MLERVVMTADRARVLHGVVSLLPRGPVGERLERAGVPVQYLGMGRVPRLAQLRRLRRAVAEWAPHVVQGWMVHGNLAALYARPRGTALAWHILHTVYRLRDHSLPTRVLILASARLSDRPQRIIYNSRTAARQHEALGYAPTRTAVIPSGFDLERFRPSEVACAEIRDELGVPPTARLVGMIGRYHPQKDHATFLDAARRVVAAGVDAVFVLAGRGVDERTAPLVQARAAAGLADRVRFLGERADVPRLSAAFDVAVLSAAHSEGFPNVLGEAMACAVPCVSTDVGDSAWIVGDTGRVVPPRDPAALAAAIRELLELAPAERRALGARARARIVEHFPLEGIRPLYERLYAEIASAS